MVVDKFPRLDRVFHALAHPARRAIVRQLSIGEPSLSQLASPLEMTFPAATKHVRVLESAPPLSVSPAVTPSPLPLSVTRTTP